MSSSVQYKLLCCADISDRIEELKNFQILCTITNEITFIFQEFPFLRLTCSAESIRPEWYGDAMVLHIRTQSQSEIILKILLQNSLLIIEYPRNQVEIQIDNNILSQIKGEYLEESGFLFIQISGLNPIKDEKANAFSNLDVWWEKILSWRDSAPQTNQYVDSALWNSAWTLHRLNAYPIHTFKLNSANMRTVSPPRNGMIPSRLAWFDPQNTLPFEILHIIDDLMWYHPDHAIEYLTNFFHVFLEKNGRISNLNDPTNDQLSIAPLWSFILLDLIKLSGDPTFGTPLYYHCKENLKWWENQRFNSDYGLFLGPERIVDLGLESSMLNSPRFNHQYKRSNWHRLDATHKRKIFPVDLNSQMCGYYQNMGVLGMMVGDEESLNYFQNAQELQSNIQEVLYDSTSQFYYDYDLECDNLQPMKTIAGFWPLYGGAASKAHVKPLSAHLANPREYWSELPVATISMDEPFFNPKEIWQGAVILSQDYWLINGLRRYNLNNLAAKLSHQILTHLNSLYKLYPGIYSYLPGNSYNVNSLTYHQQPWQNSEMSIGHSPIHSIFYRGLLGAEILDSSVNFVPDWCVLEKEVHFSFYYRGQKIETYLSKMDKKMLEFCID